MELLQLKIVTILSDTLSFSKTAEMLHITQPAVTYHLKKLEDELGLILFERNAHQTRITDAGREFVKYASTITDLSSAAMQSMRSMREGQLSNLSVGTTYGSSDIAAEYISGVLDRYPDLHIISYCMNAAEIKDSLKQKIFDVYFGPEESLIDSTGYDITRVSSRKFQLLVPKGTEDLIHGNDWSGLSDCTFLYPIRQNHVLAAKLTDLYESHNLKPKAVSYLDTPGMILRMINDGHGVALMSDSFSFSDTYQNIAAVPIDDKEAEFHTLAAVRSAGKSDPMLYLESLLRKKAI